MRRPQTKHLLTGATVIALMLVSVPATSVSTSLSATPLLAPATAAADLNAGAKAVERGQYGEAVERLSRAIESRTLNGEALALAYHHRGIARQKLGFDGMAVLDYTLAIEQNALPKDVLARAYYNRGLAISEGGDKIGAESDYTRAIELAPDYAAAYHNRANLERARQDYPTAIRDYTVAISHLDGKNRKLPLMGRALSQQKSGNVASATADIDQVLAIDPNYAPALAKRQELASVPVTDDIVTGSIAPGVGGLEPAHGSVIKTSSEGGWETKAVRYDNDGRSRSPAASDDTALETASLRDIDMVPAPTERGAAVASAAARGPALTQEGGRYKMQLGAFRAADIAAQAWDQISKRNGTLVATLDHSIEEADLGERGIYYRLQAGSFQTASDAKSGCAAFEASKIDCIVVAR
ncbi:MAG TPA: SPOR domain-containing protein [Parvibaculum sp.]